MSVNDYGIQRFVTGPAVDRTGEERPVRFSLSELSHLHDSPYTESDMRGEFEDYDITEGIELERYDIGLFARVYGDDQALHTGDAEERRELDREYGIFEMFPDAEEQVIVPGAQLFHLVMEELDDVEYVDEVSFTDAVYEGDEVRLFERSELDEYDELRETAAEEIGDTDGTDYVFGKREAGTDEYSFSGHLTLEHGEDNSDIFARLVPAGMGFWPREGDVLMGYEDLTVEDGFDHEDDLTFRRDDIESARKEVDGVGLFQTYENEFVDGTGAAFSYQPTNLHL